VAGDRGCAAVDLQQFQHAFFMRQMQGGAGGRGGPMSFGKSKARCSAKIRSR
jgi:ATP-dependent Zn protease